MAETILHPRPSFYTFLQSDNPKGSDALTDYDYQRALRAKKVEILQQKRSISYEPGYMKPWATTSSSRKVFQLKSRYPIAPALAAAINTAVSKNEKIPPKELANEKISKSCPEEIICGTDSVASLDGLEQTASKTSLSGAQQPASGRPSSTTGSRPSSATGQNPSRKTVAGEGVSMQVQSERLPRIPSKPRLVKSATARDNSVSSSIASPRLPKRPKTVATADLRDTQTQTASGAQQELQGASLEDKPLLFSVHHPQAHSDGSNQIQLEMTAAEGAQLCKSYQWATTTQRSYDEVFWPERPIPSAYLPTTTIERFPDPVSQRLTFRRYNSEPAAWQTVGAEWDYVQTRRCDTYIKGPQAIAFCDVSKKIQQIPGYSGYVPGLGKFEENTAYTSPAVLVRTLQPRKTKISRRANIPGYTGHVHWTKMAPTHSNMPVPEPTTSGRVHRPLPLEDMPSPFRRDGVMSKMITTVSPHNPFNNIQY